MAAWHSVPLLLAQRQRCQADLITPQLAADVLNCSPLFLFHFHPLEFTPPFHSNHRSTCRFFKATLSNVFYVSNASNDSLHCERLILLRVKSPVCIPEQCWIIPHTHQQLSTSTTVHNLYIEESIIITT